MAYLLCVMLKKINFKLLFNNNNNNNNNNNYNDIIIIKLNYTVCL